MALTKIHNRLIANKFDTLAELVASTDLFSGEVVEVASQLAWTPPAEPTGGSTYVIMTAAEYGAVPDGFIDHYIGVGNSHVAKLVQSLNDKTVFATMSDLKAGVSVKGSPTPHDGDEVELASYHAVGTGTGQPSNYRRDVSKDDNLKASTDWLNNGLVSGEIIAYGPNGEAYVYVNKNNGEFIDITALGLKSGDDLNDYIPWAAEYAQDKRIRQVLIWGVDANLTGGLEINLGANGIVIGGPSIGGVRQPVITHTGDNIGIKFIGAANLWARGSLQNMRIIGNAGSNAVCVEFQDSWHNSVKHLFGTDYTNGALIQVHNYSLWTENFTIDDVMSRTNKYGVRLKRTAAMGGTASFFAFNTKNYWHQFGVPDSYAIYSPNSASSSEAIALYGCNIEVGGWFEVGGGHRTIQIGDYNSLVESSVITRLDGYGGLLGTDLYTFSTTQLGLIDIEARTLNQQGGFADVSAQVGGTLLAPRALVSQFLKSDHKGPRPRCRAKGATITMIAEDIADDRTYTIDDLPVYSRWRATLTVEGPNLEFSEIYEITVPSIDFTTRVISQSIPTTSTAESVNPNIQLQSFGGGTGGNFLVNGSGKIEWKINAATLGNTYTSTLELEML